MSLVGMRPHTPVEPDVVSNARHGALHHAGEPVFIGRDAILTGA